LIGSRQLERGGGVPSAAAAAEACGQLYRELARWVGADGCHALFARALAEARGNNSALTEIQLRERSDPYVQGVAESITAHGEPATVTALESMLTVLVDLLRRLIGNDMAVKLIDRALATSSRADPTTHREREES
jgi:hypothetical protein